MLVYGGDRWEGSRELRTAGPVLCRRFEHVVCGGVVCDSSFCCSTCDDGEVCPGPGLESRADCPPVHCE